MNNILETLRFSFIIIGKNEGWKLSLCFNSILKAVTKIEIKEYEILYVDSRSIDDSMERAIEIPHIRRFYITGDCNAAIARNIGGKEANGDILIFLDGDMELQVDFIPHLFNEDGTIIHPFMSGVYHHWYYDKDWNLISKEQVSNPNKNQFQIVTGGFFIITKKIWNKVGGMDSRLSVNEDFDLGFRLSQQGIYALCLNQVGINHHTIPYVDRIWKFIPKYRYMGWLARKHFFNTNYWKISWRRNCSSLVLMLSLVCILFFPYSFVAYLFVVVVRAMTKGIGLIPKRLSFFILRDIVFLLAFMCFYPEIKNITYKQF